jgi:hypothetical protein
MGLLIFTPVVCFNRVQLKLLLAKAISTVAAKSIQLPGKTADDL